MSLSAGVNAKASQNGAASVTTANRTTSKGSGVVLFVYFGSSINFTSVSDSYGNADWIEIGSEFTFNSIKSRMFYCPHLKNYGVNHTFTLTTSSTSDAKSIYMMEILTTNGVGIKLDTSDRNSDSSSPFTSPSISASSAPLAGMLFAGGSGNTGGAGVDTWTAGASFTMLDNETDWVGFYSGASGYRIISSGGSYNSSWTTTQTTSTAQWIASFIEATPVYTLDYSLFPKYKLRR